MKSWKNLNTSATSCWRKNSLKWILEVHICLPVRISALSQNSCCQPATLYGTRQGPSGLAAAHGSGRAGGRLGISNESQFCPTKYVYSVQTAHLLIASLIHLKTILTIGEIAGSTQFDLLLE
jgi:hypothetical protein